MDIFARLEVHDGLQVLGFITHEDGETGVTITFMTQPDIQVAIKIGPYPDTQAGWLEAQQHMLEFDFKVFAAAAAKSRGVKQKEAAQC